MKKITNFPTKITGVKLVEKKSIKISKIIARNTKRMYFEIIKYIERLNKIDMVKISRLYPK